MTMEINTRAYLLFHLADQFETTRVPQFRPKQHRRYSKVLELDLHMMQVEVLGKSIEISVFQKSKTVWVAQGVYVGKPYQAQGRTEPRAASAWVRAVVYQNTSATYLGDAKHQGAAA
jgi:hypothetical protein